MISQDDHEEGAPHSDGAAGKPASAPHSGASSLAALPGPDAAGPAIDRAFDSADGKDRGKERPRSARPRSAANIHGPNGVQDLSELPETYGVDEVEVLCKDPWWYFAYWEVTEPGLAAAREQLGSAAPTAKMVLRVFVSSSTPSSGKRGRDGREIRDVPIYTNHGRRYLEAPRPNALLRVAVGLLSPEGYFATIAHSSVVRMPPQQPSSETSVEWLHVLPVRGDGHHQERISIVKSPEPAHVERALPWREGQSGPGGGDALSVLSPAQAGGASELARPPSEALSAEPSKDRP